MTDEELAALLQPCPRCGHVRHMTADDAIVCSDPWCEQRAEYEAELARLRADNERLRAALTDLRSLAETFTLVAAYQGTPLTALSESVEAAWHVLYGRNSRQMREECR